MESAQEGSGATRRRYAVVLWLLAIPATLLLYWAILRFLQPGYFAPWWPYHIDFYDYVGMRMKAASTLLLGYPRPLAYYAMHLFGAGGMKGFMGGAIALALLNLLLTAGYVRRVLQLQSPWFFASLLLYLVLNLAHPQFYPEHRHDLPAMVSYFGLIAGLLAWDSWLQVRERGLYRAILLPFLTLLILSAVVCFSFSKETYFISALCLVAALAIAEPSRRWFHAGFFIILLIFEAASFLWTRSTNSPFVNVSAGADSTYRISVEPLSVIHTLTFYVSHLVNPWLLALLLCAVVFAPAPRSRWLLIAAFPISAIATFAPHSILPNHKFAEYAWAAAPLFLAPVLLLGETALRPLQIAIALALTIAAIAGPRGYHRRYGSGELAWILQQERMGGALVQSLKRLRDLRPPARVLVTGLTDPAVPWQVVDFIRLTFGEQVNWTVVLPPDAKFRRGSRVVAFVDPAEVNPADYDYIATYRASGELVAVRDAKTALAAEQALALAVPALAPVVAKCGEEQSHYQPLLECAAAALEWGRASDAAEFLNRAQRAGGKAAPQFNELSQRTIQIRQEQAAKTISGTLAARPETIVAATGVGVTEVIWEVPEGLAVEIHVDAPDGPLFAAATRSGSARTAEWVKDGMQFFLQNVTGGKPLTPQNTLASVKVRVSK